MRTLFFINTFYFSCKSHYSNHLSNPKKKSGLINRRIIIIAHAPLKQRDAMEWLICNQFDRKTFPMNFLLGTITHLKQKVIFHWAEIYQINYFLTTFYLTQV